MKRFEVCGVTLSLVLFGDVTNSKSFLICCKGEPYNQKPRFLMLCFVILEIPDVFPVLAAGYKALMAKSRDSLATRTLHSDFVYNYSGCKHISESLKRCGISEGTSYILAARFGASDEEMEVLKGLINGIETPLESLESRADQALILKHYKISTPELQVSSLSDAIVCRIAA